MDTAIAFQPELIRRYSGPAPRYTSYPTAPHFNSSFDVTAYRALAEQRFSAGQRRPLSLYVHIPFCNTICYYCGCNKIITKDHGRSAKYIRYLAKEIVNLSPTGTVIASNDAEVRTLGRHASARAARCASRCPLRFLRLI